MNTESVAFNLAVSPDFPPDHIAGWYVFNTWLQKKLGIRMNFKTHDSFSNLRAAIAADQVDLIYANPYDAATLVREKDFLPLAKPTDMPDEVVVAVGADSSVQSVDDLEPGVAIASADGPDVQRMGLIILESADVNADNSRLTLYGSNALVAKALLQGKADVGIFLQRAYNELSEITRRGLRPLVVSKIDVIGHHLLAGPRLAERRETLLGALAAMSGNSYEQTVLGDIGIAGWTPVDREEVEFLIDLIDTLVD